MIISGLKPHFNLSPTNPHTSYHTTKFLKFRKISPETKIKPNMQAQTSNTKVFEEFVLLILPLLKKAHKICLFVC